MQILESVQYEKFRVAKKALFWKNTWKLMDKLCIRILSYLISIIISLLNLKSQYEAMMNIN